jgi:catechol 2,3-dioxygenase-like lactoylglutathione lyase family enzyme
MIRGVQHVSFTVSDMERSLKFYRDGLGFEVVNDREIEGSFPETLLGLKGAHLRIVHLKGHGQGLELMQFYAPRGKTAPPRPCDVGCSHLCYAVEDMNAVVERLKKLGVQFFSQPIRVEDGPNAGGSLVYFLDPDGITMEMVQLGPRAAKNIS